jgi:mRNA-degrading endonuclease YafQ of YafQ-DinJ toxin-antitoxin module
LEKVIDIEVIQSQLFQRQKKKLHKNQIKKLDSQIRDIIKDPDISEDKKGALKGVRVHKFHAGKQLLLLAYEVAGESLQLIMIGSHENFYRDLQKYNTT